MTHRTIDNLLHRVRDTDWVEHTEPALVAIYGSSLVQDALNLGFIERQSWLRRSTVNVDLAPAGEKYLIMQVKARMAA